MRPIVSVVTPTWRRHAVLLERCVPAVQAQTYPRVEHVIVSDGPDPLLEGAVAAHLGRAGDSPSPRVPVRCFSLGRNWTSFLEDSHALAASVAGDFLAAGDYLTNVADDDLMAPEHLETLVDALEAHGADFAFGRVRMVYRDGREHVIPVEGVDCPMFGQITSVVYRAKLLQLGHWRLGDGLVADWALVRRWLDAGARYVYVPEETFTHYADH